ncbi:hypothetical protein BJX68DRAFT_89575 [Aspergillus pseudodeflectus]|uniref:Uncharacterized protein n=1 Tax=Aspergillus pseudodeflectus TaxID=176178 RepID=A0ABR4L7V8_9EURO
MDTQQHQGTYRSLGLGINCFLLQTIRSSLLIKWLFELDCGLLSCSMPFGRSKRRLHFSIIDGYSSITWVAYQGPTASVVQCSRRNLEASSRDRPSALQIMPPHSSANNTTKTYQRNTGSYPLSQALVSGIVSCRLALINVTNNSNDNIMADMVGRVAFLPSSSLSCRPPA